ncbi:MAG TPA: NAD-dependent epimerase/dehydratase family protein [Burkholderiales bacterium]|nr:NAD-dependent epimerase/dehydratase family protein [Burkholderiales bacterium]
MPTARRFARHAAGKDRTSVEGEDVTSALVLGGAGFMGAHLAEGLLRAGHRVRIFDRPRVDGLALLEDRKGPEIVTGDFLNPEDLSRALGGTNVVFHLISTTLPKSSNDNPVYDVETNVLGTLRLLSLCRRHGVRKIVFVSSGGTVYGVPRTIPIDESHPTEPICSYGIHKLAIEKHLYLNRLLHGLDYCVLRVSNAYGERQRTDTAQGTVPVFLERALRGKTIQVWGDGSVVRDYVYVGDIVEALLLALAYEGAQKVFNIGSGTGVTLNQLIEEIGAVTGRDLSVEYTPARSFDVPANVLDTTLAHRFLGWKARTPLRDGLRRTCEWLQRSQ